MARDDFLYVDVLGERNLIRNLDRMPETVRVILVAKVRDWANKTAAAVRENILQRLKGSGKLAQSVEVELINDGMRVEGRVYIAGQPHALAQERGAAIPPHIIRPRNGKILAFYGAMGDKVFATRVFHPGGQIPAAHFMKDAYREMGPEISRGIKKAVIDGIRANMRKSA